MLIMLYSHFIKKKVLFHDNICAHTSSIAVTKLYELRFEWISHAPNLTDLSHSSDLALNDFFLFPNIKKCFTGKRFNSNPEVIDEIECLLWRCRDIVLYRRYKKVKISLKY